MNRIVIVIFMVSVFVISNAAFAATSLSPSPAKKCNVVVTDNPGQKVVILDFGGHLTSKECTTETNSGPANGECQINLQGLANGAYIAKGSSSFNFAITSGGTCCEDINSNNKCDALENLGTGCCQSTNACLTNEAACAQIGVTGAYWYDFGNCENNICISNVQSGPASGPGAPGRCNIQEHGICVTEEQTATVTDESGGYQKIITLELPSEADPDNSFCFLTKVFVGKVGEDKYPSGCEIIYTETLNTKKWELKARRENTYSKQPSCSAQCVYWRDDIDVARHQKSDVVYSWKDPKERNLVSSQNSLCGLDLVWLKHLRAEQGRGTCEIKKADSGNWILKASGAGEGAGWCRATCISWDSSEKIGVFSRYLEASAIKTEDIKTEDIGTAYSEENNGPSPTNSSCFFNYISMHNLNTGGGQCSYVINSETGLTQIRAHVTDDDDDGSVKCQSYCLEWQHTQQQQPQECGNGVIDAGEDCDCGSDGTCTLTELNSKTCEALNFGAGELTCNPSGSENQCKFSTSSCGYLPPLCQGGTCTPDTSRDVNRVCDVAPRTIAFSRYFEDGETQPAVQDMGAGASGYQSLNEHYEGSQSYQFKSKSDSGYSIVVFDLNSFGVSLENGATYTLEAMVWANAPDFARIYGVVDNVSDFASNRVGTSLFHGGNRQWQKLSYTFVASGTNHKIILEIKGHNGADAYFDNLEMRKHERACFDACEIANTRITQKCTRNDNCNIRDKIEMYIEYEKSDFDICPANPILQIDAKDSEETCSIEYNGGDISGMTLNCTPEKIGSVSGKVTCRGNWTIPDIPNACKGKEVSAFSVGIYKNGVDSNNHVAGTWENVRGSFKFTDSPTTPKTCGDGAVQTPNDAGVNEQCDGTNLNNKKCQDVTSPVKYGTLSCKTDCTFDKTQCTLDQPRVPECGDGIISANSTEECDDNNVVSGDGCSSSCIREYCGDGIVNNGEQCDGTNLDGKTCSSVGRGAGSGLACYPNASGTGCTFDVSACPVLCTDDNHCDAQTEDATCDDCKTARFRTISASTKSFGVMFNATFTPSYFNPLKFIACKSGEDRQDCIDDFDAGSCGIDSACLCGSNLEKGCNLICNDESGDFYLYAEGFSQTAMSSQISNYECPHLQIDELEAARDDMQDLLERIVTAALVMTERNADPADIALMEQARGLALNLVLQLNNLIDDYETSYVTVDQINYALGSYRNTKPTIMSLINQALS